MEYPIKVNSRQLYKAILTILNFKLNLTNLEIDVVSTLMNYGIVNIDTTSRDIIRKELNISKYSTNNYIIQLKSKSIILSNQDGKLYLNPSMYELVKDKEISFKFEVNDNNS